MAALNVGVRDGSWTGQGHHGEQEQGELHGMVLLRSGYRQIYGCRVMCRQRRLREIRDEETL
jgi:hypothetical protein